jgi:hypothetical protein
LAVVFYPVRSPFTGAELYVEMVGTIEVNNEDSLRGIGRHARSVLVAGVEAES